MHQDEYIAGPNTELKICSQLQNMASDLVFGGNWLALI